MSCIDILEHHMLAQTFSTLCTETEIVFGDVCDLSEKVHLKFLANKTLSCLCPLLLVLQCPNFICMCTMNTHE